MARDEKEVVKNESMSEPKVKAVETGSVKITPLRDYILHSPPIAVNVKLEKGKEIDVDKRFLAALKTEKVI